MNPGAHNKEKDLVYQGGQVVALIRKGWGINWKTKIVHASIVGTNQECEYM